MNNKRILLICSLVGFIIAAVITFLFVSSNSSHSSNAMYTTYEDSMKLSAKNKVLDCETNPSLNCNFVIIEDNNVTNSKFSYKVPLSSLIEEGYIESIDKLENEAVCDFDKSYILVTLNDEEKLSYDYKACLSCNNYKTDGCFDDEASNIEEQNNGTHDNDTSTIPGEDIENTENQAICSDINNRILTFVGDQGRKIANCRNVSYNNLNSDIVSISDDGIITPLKIGTGTVNFQANGTSYNVQVIVDHEKIVDGNNTLVIYEVPNAESLSNDYDVYVKLPGESESNYHKIQVFKSLVAYADLEEKWHMSYSYYANFDFHGVVNVKVIPKYSFTNFRLRGNIYSQKSTSKNGVITFNLSNYGVISLELKNGSNYDTRHNLHLFANTLDDKFDSINLSDPNLIYVGPGEHKCINGTCSYESDKTFMIEKRTGNTSSNSYPAAINLTSNKTLYLSGSAVFHAQVSIDKWNSTTSNSTKLSNINIYGRGTLDTSDLITNDASNLTYDDVKKVESINFTDSNVTSGLIRVVYANNINIDGVILKNSKSYNIYLKDSDNINISNIKAISLGKYTDGIHLLSSRNIKVNNAFIRSCDDGIAIYASRGSGGYKSGSFVSLNGDSTNLTYNNLLLWTDNGRSVYIGYHGNYDSPFGKGNKIENVTIDKVRILENNKRINNEGALTIGAADNNYVHKVSFSNIVVDHLMEGNLISVKNYCSNYGESVYANTKDSRCGYMINDVSFNNIDWSGRYDSTKQVEAWINILGTQTSNESRCSVDYNDHVISLISFSNVKLGDIILNDSNKNGSYGDRQIYKNNKCVYNQSIN